MVHDDAAPVCARERFPKCIDDASGEGPGEKSVGGLGWDLPPIHFVNAKQCVARPCRVGSVDGSHGGGDLLDERRPISGREVRATRGGLHQERRRTEPRAFLVEGNGCWSVEFGVVRKGETLPFQGRHVRPRWIPLQHEASATRIKQVRRRSEPASETTNHDWSVATERGAKPREPRQRRPTPAMSIMVEPGRHDRSVAWPARRSPESQRALRSRAGHARTTLPSGRGYRGPMPGNR